MIKRTPANPTKTAIHRRHPTRSPKIGIDKAVSIIGLRKMIANAVARGKFTNDKTTKIEVAVPNIARVIVLARFFVDSKLKLPAHATRIAIGMNVNIPR